MADIDPLVPVLAGLVVDSVWFLDSCDDGEVDPDSAVRMLESVASVLKGLPSEQLDRFLVVLRSLAEVEPEPSRREFLEAFPFTCGLVEEESCTVETSPGTLVT
ncbi:hypothetical protein [Kitasatospora sp. NPDC056731]|uniref:hypothetical protein n=1 Tax=Kitasatospora sp. NPDC056731 TaxID=3155422 RepID=UPI003434F54A